MFVNIHSHHEVSSPSNLINISNLTINSDFNIEKYSFSKASAGIHPWFIEIENLEKQFQKLEQCLALENVIFLGECGLDKINGPGLEVQISVFIRQIKIAERLKMPVMIHCVKSFNELIKVKQDLDVRVPLIIHGFNKKHELASELIKYGFYLSFGRSILNSKTAGEVIKQVPIDRLFLETDDAEIEIEKLYLKTSELRNEPLAEIEGNIFNNYKNLFS